LSYVAKVINAPAVRKDVFLTVGFDLEMLDMSHTTFASYQNIYKVDLDVSNIEFLLCSWDGEGGNCWLRLSVGGVVQFTEAGGVTMKYKKSDISAISGDKEILLEARNTDGGASQMIQRLKLWGLEA